MLQSIKEYYRVLHSITEYYRVLQSITEYYRVLQSVSSASTWTNFWACLLLVSNTGTAKKTPRSSFHVVIKLLPITCTMYKWLPYYANSSSWIFAKEGILWWQHAHYASLHMLALHPTSSSKTSMLCKDQVLCKFTSMEDKDTNCKFHNWAARPNRQR